MRRREKNKPPWMSAEDWNTYNSNWDAIEDRAPYEQDAKAEKPKITKNYEILRDAITERVGVFLSFDEFAGKAYVKGLGEGYDGELSDKAIRCLRYRLIEEFYVRQTPATNTLTEVCWRMAEKNAYHPVKDWFKRIEWDGKPRLQTWPIFYLHAEDTPLIRKMGELWMIAGVRRMLAPGTKFDHVLLLQGKTGKGKSSALCILAHRDEWFSDAFPRFDDPRAQVEALQGKFIMEYAELAGIKKADGEQLKAFFSRRFDRARPAYGRLVVERGRQCIFGASTEEPDCLHDLSNRRWWPMAVGRVEEERLRDDHEQLWAEAVAMEAEGLPLALPEDLWEAAIETQMDFTKAPPFAEALARIVGEGDGAFPCSKLREWLLLSDNHTAWLQCSAMVAKSIRYLGFTRVHAGCSCHGVAKHQGIYVRNRGEHKHYSQLPTITYPSY